MKNQTIINDWLDLVYDKNNIVITRSLGNEVRYSTNLHTSPIFIIKRPIRSKPIELKIGITTVISGTDPIDVINAGVKVYEIALRDYNNIINGTELESIG